MSLAKGVSTWPNGHEAGELTPAKHLTTLHNVGTIATRWRNRQDAIGT